MEKLKANMCKIQFNCTENYPNECCYSDNNQKCKYRQVQISRLVTRIVCTSAVARVNALILNAKELGVELVQKKGKNDGKIKK